MTAHPFKATWALRSPTFLFPLSRYPSFPLSQLTQLPPSPCNRPKHHRQPSTKPTPATISRTSSASRRIW
ncbi:hypothetical protein TorRG33x02_135730 [Trema orientale]|uniref:Uncharacterized protein n=1 Tax=Trema orientale TaxID=63057 RepID=A0A2P5EYU7_TREOI|nr:hypothetical protein TorRG33x02_135730 [Trema orientale]